MDEIKDLSWTPVGEPLAPGDGAYLLDALQRRHILARLADVETGKRRRVVVEVGEMNLRRALAVRRSVLDADDGDGAPDAKGGRLLSALTAAVMGMLGVLRIGRAIHSATLRGALGAAVGIIAFAMVYFLAGQHIDNDPPDTHGDGQDQSDVTSA
jgi:hypothetical protein